MHYVTWCSARRMRSISAPPDATLTFGTLAGVIGFPRTPRPSSRVLIGGDWQPRPRCIGGDLLQLRPHCVWHLVWSQVRCFVNTSAKHETNEAREVEYEGLRVCRFRKETASHLEVVVKQWENYICCVSLYYWLSRSFFIMWKIQLFLFFFFKEVCRVE